MSKWIWPANLLVAAVIRKVDNTNFEKPRHQAPPGRQVLNSCRFPGGGNAFYSLFHFQDLDLLWLVVFGHPSEKYEFVNWDDDIPNWMGT